MRDLASTFGDCILLWSDEDFTTGGFVYRSLQILPDLALFDRIGSKIPVNGFKPTYELRAGGSFLGYVEAAEVGGGHVVYPTVAFLPSEEREVTVSAIEVDVDPLTISLVEREEDETERVRFNVAWLGLRRLRPCGSAFGVEASLEDVLNSLPHDQTTTPSGSEIRELRNVCGPWLAHRIDVDERRIEVQPYFEDVIGTLAGLTPKLSFAMTSPPRDMFTYAGPDGDVEMANILTAHFDLWPLIRFDRHAPEVTEKVAHQVISLLRGLHIYYLSNVGRLARMIDPTVSRPMIRDDVDRPDAIERYSVLECLERLHDGILAHWLERSAAPDTDEKYKCPFDLSLPHHTDIRIHDLTPARILDVDLRDIEDDVLDELWRLIRDAIDDSGEMIIRLLEKEDQSLERMCNAAPATASAEGLEYWPSPAQVDEISESLRLKATHRIVELVVTRLANATIEDSRERESEEEARDSETKEQSSTAGNGSADGNEVHGDPANQAAKRVPLEKVLLKLMMWALSPNPDRYPRQGLQLRRRTPGALDVFAVRDAHETDCCIIDPGEVLAAIPRASPLPGGSVGAQSPVEAVVFVIVLPSRCVAGRFDDLKDAAAVIGDRMVALRERIEADHEIAGITSEADRDRQATGIGDIRAEWLDFGSAAWRRSTPSRRWHNLALFWRQWLGNMSESGYEAASEVDNAFASGSVDELRVRLLTELQLRKSSELAELQTYSSDPLQMLLSARARAPIGSLGDWANNKRYVRALRDELHRKSLGYAARDYPPEIMDCPDDDVGVISEAQKFTQVGELLRAVLPDDLSSELKGSHKEVQAFLGDPSPQTAEALARSAPGGLCTALAEATVLLEKLRNDTDASAQRQRSRFTEAHRDQFEIVKAILDNADRPGWCQTETAWEFLRKKDPAFWVVTDLEATISKIDDVRRELLERFLFMDLEEPLYPAALAVEDMRWLVAEVEGRSEGLPGVEPLDSDELEKVLSLLATLWAVHDDDLTGRIQGLLRLVLRAPSTAVESLTLLTRALPEYGDRDPDAVAELCAGI